MKTKMKLAHEYMQNTLNLLRKHDIPYDFESLIEESYEYAEAMIAEEDKRNEEDVLLKHKAVSEGLIKVDTFCRKEGQRLEDAKRFIESYKLVESCGGLEKAKKMLLIEQSKPYYYYSDEVVNSLKQAISDMESCL